MNGSVKGWNITGSIHISTTRNPDHPLSSCSTEERISAFYVALAPLLPSLTDPASYGRIGVVCELPPGATNGDENQAEKREEQAS